MKIPLYHVDAVTHEVFRGNPAAMCLLDSWLEPDLMQKIAGENKKMVSQWQERRQKKLLILHPGCRVSTKGFLKHP